MHKVEKKVETFIKERNLIPEGSKVLLAVSGGADSTALLCILHKIVPNRLYIAHINHQLRGKDSLNDEYYVKRLAKKYDLPVTVELADVHSYSKEKKLSIETAARELRRKALLKTAEIHKCEIIATAHHKNDNAETVIQRILRGTGFKGLAGIRLKRIINGKYFISPLLCLTRQEIEDYLRDKNIPWQSDQTNLDCRFTRNRIRHKFLPYLTKENQNLLELITNLSAHCGNLANDIEKYSEAVIKNCFVFQSDEQIAIDLQIFLKEPNPIQVEIIQKALAKLKCGLREYTFEHYTKIFDFLKNADAGKSLTIPGKIKITKGYDKFFIGITKTKNEKTKSVILNVPGKTVFENYIIETEFTQKSAIDINQKNKNTEWFDMRQIKMPLTARYRFSGDKFKPFGVNHFQKIGKFLTSQKIDHRERNSIFLICDDEKILWLAPIRRSNEAVITAKNVEIVEIKVSNLF